MKHSQLSNQSSSGPLDRIIQLSLRNRGTVLVLALLTFAGGLLRSSELSIDVFPDLNRPVVTVLVEAPGLAAEDLERKIVLPLERALMGAPGVEGIRSSSRRGVATVRLEFPWDMDIYRARQIVNEKLDGVRSELGEGEIHLGPISSVMGEIMLIGLTPAEGSGTTLTEIRTFADWEVRKRLLAIPGIASVTALGGESKTYDILVNEDRLARSNLSLLDVSRKLEPIGQVSGGGFFEEAGEQVAFRNQAEIYTASEIAQAHIGFKAGRPLQLEDVASVRIGHLPRRGDAGISGRPGVIVAVQKQPGYSTLDLTTSIHSELSSMQEDVKASIQIHPELFLQAGFIETAIDNVAEAIRDGSIIVILVLILFLWNVRTTIITVLALPLSLLGGLLVLEALGLQVNTMTLGGLAVAIGELVDDAVVDVENCFRRLRENQAGDSPRSSLAVVFEASSEIRNSIVLATATVILVFVPFLFMEGVEGRLFQPLVIAYIVAIAVSLLVALTITPVLAYLLLGKYRISEKESLLVRYLKSWQARNLQRLLDRPSISWVAAGLLLLLGLVAFSFLPLSFLPEFNEGTLTLEVISAPGNSLETSAKKAGQIESILKEYKEISHFARRTGRAEGDEHAEGVHYSEFDVGLIPGLSGSRRHELIGELRERFAKIEAVNVGFGQPISHRLDHLLSGIRSEMAVRIYAVDLRTLQYRTFQVNELIQEIPGAVDVRAEAMNMAPELKTIVNHEAAGKNGLAAPDIVDTLQIAQLGRSIGAVRDGERFFPVRIRLEDSAVQIESLKNLTLRHRPDGTPVKLAQVADVFSTRGPYEIPRENGQRAMVVQFNVEDRSLEDMVSEVQSRLDELDWNSQRYELAGRYAVARQSTQRLLLLSAASLLLISLLVYAHFRSWILTGQILLNLPVAAVGGLLALLLTGSSLTLASMVGFVALTGIAARNGILMLSHFEHLMLREGETLGPEMILRGALERLVPMLMTAGTAMLALSPVLLSGPDAAGKEILFPVALVITGGLITSTLLDILITPVLYYQIGLRFHPLAGREDSHD